jgi:hypothetical protein
MKNYFLILTLVAFSFLTSQAFADKSKVDYPEGYRNWTHIKSMLIEPGHPLENPFQGIHHIYGNDSALNGLETGTFSNGSVFVFDLLGYSQKSHAIQEGKRKLVGVMVKNKNKYKSTGGWGFEGFSGDSKGKRLVDDGGKSCFLCHTSQEKNGYVFSKIRN